MQRGGSKKLFRRAWFHKRKIDQIRLKRVQIAKVSKPEEKAELAQAESAGVEKEAASQTSPATGAEAAGTAAGPTSIFGSVAMVPVAAVGCKR